MNLGKISYVYAGFTILFWGTAATAFKITLENFTFIQLLAWASLFSTIILFTILLLTGKFRELFTVTQKQIATSFILGMFNPFAYYFILLRAYELLPAQVAQPLNFVWPIVLVVLSIPILGEKLTLRSFIALVASFIGVVLITSQGEFSLFKKSDPLGVFLALSSSVAWALYWLFNLKYSKIDPVVRLFMNFAFATLFSFAAGIFFNDFWILNLKGIFGSLYVGAFEMGITFYLWLKALSLAKSTAKLGNIIYVVPFVSLVFINTVVGEKIYWTTIVGLLIIVSSILFQQLSPSKKL
ncbi:MAG TPA: DMT family transporter [Tenuifilaceae bacterium]|nr:DMT family transporter [Tenuifilaceae bacterium]HPE18627.1 DMT family transporter [Tenuifilaceae bacterium]HPJ46091.1 DMT family transporter [Tenuifilaceae bacterium]HPQ34435.1 DMT family transporter [Tenuifilaceae bacterium]HRX67831.1 DMT family transporter [Tenuifilaceae bacterium]